MSERLGYEVTTFQYVRCGNIMSNQKVRPECS